MPKKVELTLEAYFLVALTSTSGIDSLVFLTLVLGALAIAAKLAAAAKGPAMALVAELEQVLS
ncbi:MAG TPA: hypothetical protein VL523_07335 [Terriglobia bacterium]|nr:hypothetical protein [Terriglobia bacterium]